MSLSFKLKQLTIMLGDAALFYAALLSTLLARYGHPDWFGSFPIHFRIFSGILLIWLLIFYLFDLYQLKILRNKRAVANNLLLAVSIAAAVSAIAFYIWAPVSRLTPKTNLLIFSLFFGALVYFWRILLVNILLSGGWRYRLMVIGDSPCLEEAVASLKSQPQFGYDVIFRLKEFSKNEEQNLPRIIAENKINAIILPPQIKKEFALAEAVYRLLPLELSIIDFISFYETTFVKEPLEELEESWFIEKIIVKRPLFDAIKRLMDIFLSLFSLIIFLPLALVIAVLIKITSRGPAIFEQKRMGKNNRPFRLYKFRTMQAEMKGPLWTTENDQRLTPLGRILRFTHLDEIPQLYNVLKGDIAFVGPRAERVELAEQYSKLPYYEIRHIIKPGLTGWAQIYYRPSASLEEAFEKLKYDIFYIKNRSLFLDLLIIFKTVKYLFTKTK